MIENVVLACVVNNIPNVIHGISEKGQFTLQHTDNYTNLDRVWDSAWVIVLLDLRTVLKAHI